MIKNIILDMGNVLLDYNPHVILDKVCDTQEEKDLIYRELFQGPEWIQGDRGELTNEQRYEGVSKRIPEALHPKLLECVKQWSICMVPIKGAMEFVQNLRKRDYRLYVLSNAATDFYDYFSKYYEVSWFEGIVVSAQEHLLKPEREIYERLVERYGLDPGECLFIDDREENVQAARDVGMAGAVFQNDFQEIIDRFQLEREPLIIREATEEDLLELLSIYKPYVEETAITFEYEVPALEEFRNRMREVKKSYPYLVAERNGKLLGYAYGGIFKNRPAYDRCVETTIYVDRLEKHQGVGRALYLALEKELGRRGILNCYACIAYPQTEDEYLTRDSVRFHERLGYKVVGTFHQCGYKYHRWYDMVWMEKMIGPHGEE